MIRLSKSAKAFVFILSLSVIVFSPYLGHIERSQAAAPSNVAGFAWSENIGWISFNSLNCDIDGDGIYEGLSEGGGATPAPAGCPVAGVVIPYGVNVDLDPTSPTYEQLSGFAWSENIGWISFDKNRTDTPPRRPYNDNAQNYIAKLDVATGEVTGWARALSACQNDLWDGAKCTGSGAGDMAGGWDGWIKLRKHVPPPGPADGGPDYGISLVGSDFTGYAWGSDVVGWIGFCNGADYCVRVRTFNPAVTNANATSIDPCTQDPWAERISWVFSDIEDDATGTPQAAYQVDVERSDLAVCSTGKQSDSINILTGNDINVFCPGFIGYGNFTYSWNVTVYDSDDNASAATPGAKFPYNSSDPNNPIATPAHRYPVANFSYSPDAGILQFMDVTFDPFNDVSGNPLAQPTSVAAGYYIKELEWIFGDGTPNDIDTFSNPGPALGYSVVHNYEDQGTFTVDLKATDSSAEAYSCYASDRFILQPVDVMSNKPRWNEAAP